MLEAVAGDRGVSEAQIAGGSKKDGESPLIAVRHRSGLDPRWSRWVSSVTNISRIRLSTRTIFLSSWQPPSSTFSTPNMASTSRWPSSCATPAPERIWATSIRSSSRGEAPRFRSRGAAPSIGLHYRQHSREGHLQRQSLSHWRWKNYLIEISKWWSTSLSRVSSSGRYHTSSHTSRQWLISRTLRLDTLDRQCCLTSSRQHCIQSVQSSTITYSIWVCRDNWKPCNWHSTGW